ncbi:hypothetical protein PS15m_008649 [Mucor circinelloides]
MNTNQTIMFNYCRDFSISSNNNRSNSSNDGNQNAYFQRSILDAIKAVNDNCTDEETVFSNCI